MKDLTAAWLRRQRFPHGSMSDLGIKDLINSVFAYFGAISNTLELDWRRLEDSEDKGEPPQEIILTLD